MSLGVAIMMSATPAHAEEENPTERNLHDRLVNILSDTGEAAGYVAKALQLCVNEGFVSIRLLCRDLQISENRASAICRWLYLSDFTERDESDAEKYRLAFSEKFFRSCDEEAKARSEREARRILTYAIQRYASDCTYERTTATIPLPNDEMKGRIIGREGRNIRPRSHRRR